MNFSPNFLLFSRNKTKILQHTTSINPCPPDPKEDSPTQHRSEYTVKRSHKLIKRHNVGVDSNSTSGLEALPVAIALVNLGLVEERAVGKENWRVTERRVKIFPHFSKSWKMFLLSLSSPLYRGSEGLTFNLENFTAKKTLKMMGFPSSESPKLSGVPPFQIVSR